jgi:hypothetical protein
LIIFFYAIDLGLFVLPLGLPLGFGSAFKVGGKDFVLILLGTLSGSFPSLFVPCDLLDRGLALDFGNATVFNPEG